MRPEVDTNVFAKSLPDASRRSQKLPPSFRCEAGEEMANRNCPNPSGVAWGPPTPSTRWRCHLFCPLTQLPNAARTAAVNASTRVASGKSDGASSVYACNARFWMSHNDSGHNGRVLGSIFGRIIPPCASRPSISVARSTGQTGATADTIVCAKAGR